MRTNAWEWDEGDLLELIALKVPESIELEYKQCGALQNTDGKKIEISKDVSSLANAAGGVIVYGIKEDGHIPTALDIGFDPNEISKEWLEQVISSRIQRRIEGVRINQIRLEKTAAGRVAYAVYVPQSSRAPHQAGDKRFYKRHNFESVPMEEYEIRDVSHRSAAPELLIEFQFQQGGATAKLTPANAKYFEPVDLIAAIRNDSNVPAHYAVVDLFIDDRVEVMLQSDDVNKRPSVEVSISESMKCSLQRFTVLWDDKRGLPLFQGISAELPTRPVQVRMPIGPKWFMLQYLVGAPGMPSKDKAAIIKVEGDIATIVHPTD